MNSDTTFHLEGAQSRNTN